MEVPWEWVYRPPPGKKKGEKKKKKKKKKRRSLGMRDMQRGWRASVCGVPGPEGYILMNGKVDTKSPAC